MSGETQVPKKARRGKRLFTDKVRKKGLLLKTEHASTEGTVKGLRALQNREGEN